MTRNPMNRQARILIVDDVPSNIQIIRQVINPEHQVFFATNGPSALQLAKEKQPDLMLLDISMPEMDGFEVCRRLQRQEETSDIPVIFITALEDEADELKGLQLGAVDFITKPIRPAIVSQRVDNHLKMRRLQQELEALSYRDGLTGIANRRLFDDQFEAEWHRGVRHKMPMALIMIDIDHFKLYNDHYGHQAGDETLQRVANAMQCCMKRSTDLLARYGGEEFVVMLPNTDTEGVKQIADTLLANVAALAIEHCKTTLDEKKITISLGLACTMPTHHTAPIALQKEADQALYVAKEAGRNQYHLAKNT
ncbi:diguanylate cyclase domain-containing protein [Magnetococcus sp. PR-3]|uniref:diguanylate cyclase domain-containing protein n=1 Tax=Magnetococcus sp. PR-3 TaxID=3120355 RepID=UPI002FCE0739